VIIDDTGPAAMFPGPGTISFNNVIERTPGGVSVSCTAAPSAPPRTGGGGDAAYVRRLGDG